MLMCRAMCISIPEGIKNKWYSKVNADSRTFFSRNSSKNPSVRFIEVEDALLKEITRIPTGSSMRDVEDDYKERILLAVEGIYRISMEQELRTLHQIDRESSTAPKEWKFVAHVLDRFFCFVFILLVIILNFYLLMSAPDEEKYVYCPMGKDKCPEDWDYYKYFPGTQALKDLLKKMLKEFHFHEEYGLDSSDASTGSSFQ
ncbi:uncharacterized protein LOC143017558 [Oratosquilla oratoria]|uniref:uncharacterized protein LOC143017558 n=1 Tax=Oratosquilla oratoria TaxID=337810 RepID=UPI003F761C4B